MLHYQLEFATAFVEADFPAGDNLGTISWFKANSLVAVTEHGAAQLGLVILQGEVPVAGRWSGKI